MNVGATVTAATGSNPTNRNRKLYRPLPASQQRQGQTAPPPLLSLPLPTPSQAPAPSALDAFNFVKVKEEPLEFNAVKQKPAGLQQQLQSPRQRQLENSRNVWESFNFAVKDDLPSLGKDSSKNNDDNSSSVATPQSTTATTTIKFMPELEDDNEDDDDTGEDDVVDAQPSPPVVAGMPRLEADDDGDLDLDNDANDDEDMLEFEVKADDDDFPDLLDYDDDADDAAAAPPELEDADDGQVIGNFIFRPSAAKPGRPSTVMYMSPYRTLLPDPSPPPLT